MCKGREKMMKKNYIAPCTTMVNLRVVEPVAQTTMHISSVLRQDNGEALAKPYQWGQDWNEGEDFVNNDCWNDYKWAE